MVRARFRIFLAAWFAVVLGLSLVSRGMTAAQRVGRCDLDGNQIGPVGGVELRSDDVLRRFCGVRCALDWPDVPPEPTWLVRDEMTGHMIDASLAHFVESRLPVVVSRSDYIHAFATWRDAAQHEGDFEGRPFPNPFPNPNGP